ncbi:hypothetical protein [Radiobacillus deserti]|uniref:Uncharacterized protein n=1 Tax=Radiobacillus deserti TaxID=2594883 RepID=A0A516KDF7_9BACI|nr:hypothetical protein [Radiobacillus deserti]QDP39441.1 hypothetical protein FN924_04170 [Radiobacillus deserti]
MKAELKALENLKHAVKEEDYKFLVAKVVVHHYKDKVNNRIDLYHKVNRVLKEHQLGSVSYGFIRNHDK